MKENLQQRAEKYRGLTEQALKEIKLAEALCKEDKKIAEDFLRITRDYFNDGCYYLRKGDFVTAIASFSYAHAWLDAGIRAGLFFATNERLFILP